MRTMVCAVVGLVLCAGSLLAAEKNATRHGEATVTKVSGDMITLTWKDRQGKEHENTIDVKENKVQLVGMDGKEAMPQDFKDGDRVEVTLEKGKVTKISHATKGEKPLNPEKPEPK